MKDENTIFMRNLKYLRKLKGISQTELANKCGLTKRMISYYETHAVNPPLDKINALANALEVSVSDLLDEMIEQKDTQIAQIDPRIVRKILEIKELPRRTQEKIWDYVDFMIEQNKKKKSKENK